MNCPFYQKKNCWKKSASEEWPDLLLEDELDELPFLPEEELLEEELPVEEWLDLLLEDELDELPFLPEEELPEEELPEEAARRMARFTT